MKQITIYVLWDEKDGYSFNKFYLDRKSAEVALQENYTEYWITNKKAEVLERKAVSYFTDAED